MAQQKQPVSGILNVYKPKGMTSHDVVNRVRRLFGQRRVGHCGTLDPMATGVLVICLGQATRLVEYIQGSRKQYWATICFGQTTNTHDAEGEFIEAGDIALVAQLKQADIEQTLCQFVGEIQQMPPPFSAIKQNGIPIYKLARQGQRVDLQPRPIKIDSIETLAWQKPELIIRVICQAGTYIRSLAHDLGQTLKVGAYLTALSREASGPWHIKDAVSLETLTEATAAGTEQSLLHALEKTVLDHTFQAIDIPAITLSAEHIAKVQQGQFIPNPFPLESESYAAYNQAGQLVAILTTHHHQILRPKKVFLANH